MSDDEISDASSSSSSVSMPTGPIVTIAAGRSRRANAGRNMASLLEQAAKDPTFFAQVDDMNEDDVDPDFAGNFKPHEEEDIFDSDFGDSSNEYDSEEEVAARGEGSDDEKVGKKRTQKRKAADVFQTSIKKYQPVVADVEREKPAVKPKSPRRAPRHLSFSPQRVRSKRNTTAARSAEILERVKEREARRKKRKAKHDAAMLEGAEEEEEPTQEERLRIAAETELLNKQKSNRFRNRELKRRMYARMKASQYSSIRFRSYRVPVRNSNDYEAPTQDLNGVDVEETHKILIKGPHMSKDGSPEFRNQKLRPKTPDLEGKEKPQTILLEDSDTAISSLVEVEKLRNSSSDAAVPIPSTSREQPESNAGILKNSSRETIELPNGSSGENEDYPQESSESEVRDKMSRNTAEGDDHVIQDRSNAEGRLQETGGFFRDSLAPSGKTVEETAQNPNVPVHSPRNIVNISVDDEEWYEQEPALDGDEENSENVWVPKETWDETYKDRFVEIPFVTVPDEEMLQTVFKDPEQALRRLQRKAKRTICPITKMPARYIDPLTKVPYHDAKAFRIIRDVYDIAQRNLAIAKQKKVPAQHQSSYRHKERNLEDAGEQDESSDYDDDDRSISESSDLPVEDRNGNHGEDDENSDASMINGVDSESDIGNYADYVKGDSGSILDSGD
ncbi:unnamed protein product [Notodromas monacha]|uniref:Vacuolar protein sorting-associated protein 72 homolog n=1 Tax=Notodromas monacha TaxID=399045 RepID=A0A7R9BS41_9CRUS|nr:unnamed protein product [Notodromas monacha]CAG0919168.1 unnamed protein product [Notodromas monacha]